MREKKTAIMNSFSQSRNEQVGTYRFLHNSAVSLEALITGAYNSVSKHIKDKHKRNYGKQPIEEEESYRWLSSVFSRALQAFLQLARDENNKQTAYLVPGRKQYLLFSGDEAKLLLKHIEGKTQKQQSRHIPESIAWVAWIIARLGGWKGYESQAPPGLITTNKGLDTFFMQYSVWKLAKDMQTYTEKPS